MKGILKKAMAAALVAVMVLSMSGCTEEEQPQTISRSRSSSKTTDSSRKLNRSRRSNPSSKR